MGLRTKGNSRAEAEAATLTTKLTELTTAVAGLQGLRDHLSEANAYGEEIAKLHKEKALLETSIARQKEDHEREVREIEHKVGLHKSQVESEIELAKKQAETEGKLAVDRARLEVESSNLTAEKERFKQELDFRTERFESEMKTVKDMATQVLDRLPKFDRTHTTIEHIGDVPVAAKQIEA